MLFLKKRSKKNAEETTEILTATLRGPGRRETCLVSAVRSGASEAAEKPTYREYRVRALPHNLADGDYDMEVNGAMLTLQVRGGESQILGGPLLSEN
ncbi:MAG: hypothetical protein ACLGXA_11325 [Acidobacteriota bacterium]